MSQQPQYVMLQGESPPDLIRAAARILDSLDTGQMMEIDEAIRTFAIMDVGSEVLADAARKLKLNLELAGIQFEEVHRMDIDATCVVELRDKPPTP